MRKAKVKVKQSLQQRRPRHSKLCRSFAFVFVPAFCFSDILSPFLHSMHASSITGREARAVQRRQEPKSTQKSTSSIKQHEYQMKVQTIRCEQVLVTSWLSVMLSCVVVEIVSHNGRCNDLATTHGQHRLTRTPFFVHNIVRILQLLAYDLNLPLALL